MGSHYIIILTVHLLNFGYVGGRNTLMNHKNHESGMTYQQL